MKDRDLQKLLEIDYGLEGDYYYCEACRFCKDKSVIKDCKAFRGHNCKYKRNIFNKIPCVKALNKHRKRMWSK